MLLALALLALPLTAPDPTQADPAQAAPVEAAPVEAAPVEAAPVEAAPAEAAPAEVPATEAAPAVEETGPRSPVPFAIAGMSGALSLGTGVAAGFISASLARSLEQAAAGEVPLTGYNARTAAFFVCAGLSAGAGLTAVVALGAGVLLE